MFAYVIIEDVSFEVEQEQSFEEVEPQFLGKKASVFFSHAYSFFVLKACYHTLNFICRYA
jgi:hypothetical protein